ncbi:hypothetical protein RKD18_000493 [Streptomyces phaeoluteigriseus]
MGVVVVGSGALSEGNGVAELRDAVRELGVTHPETKTLRVPIAPAASGQGVQSPVPWSVVRPPPLLNVLDWSGRPAGRQTG